MTLIELLIVMGIIGLIVSMSIPSFAGYAERVRLKAAARQTVGLVSLARSLAISSREEQAVIVDREHGELRVVNLASGDAYERVVRFPSSVAVTLEMAGEPSADTQFVFRPSGSLAGRSVALVLESRQTRQTIAVSGPTGSITVQ